MEASKRCLMENTAHLLPSFFRHCCLVLSISPMGLFIWRQPLACWEASADCMKSTATFGALPLSTLFWGRLPAAWGLSHNKHAVLLAMLLSKNERECVAATNGSILQSCFRAGKYFLLVSAWMLGSFDRRWPGCHSRKRTCCIKVSVSRCFEKRSSVMKRKGTK